MNSTCDYRKEIKGWLKPTLLKEKLTDYSISVSGTTEKGGYLGDITFVTVCGKSEKEEKNYHFVIKCGKRSKKLREVMPVRMVFENEIHFYTEILPEFLKFQKEKNVKHPFENVAKCYETLCEETEILILENMNIQGYELHDRKKCMNEDHIRKILETYGKFHAISFALRDQNPQLFHKLSEKLIDLRIIQDKMGKRDKKVTLFQQIIDLAIKEKEYEIVEKCEHLKETAPSFRKNAINPNDPCNVITHGDCWNNNFLFKYEDGTKTKVADVCFLDFQISSLASPIFDLSFFLFTTLSEETVKQFDEFINYYYENLSISIRNLGSDPHKLFSFETFMEHWKQFSRFGLLLMPPITKLCLWEDQDVPNFVKAAKDGKDVKEMFSDRINIKYLEKYKNRTLPVMKLAIAKKFV